MRKKTLIVGIAAASALVVALAWLGEGSGRQTNAVRDVFGERAATVASNRTPGSAEKEHANAIAESPQPQRSPVTHTDLAPSVLDPTALRREEWTKRLDAARRLFETQIDGEHNDPISAAIGLVNLCIASDLDQQGRYELIAAGEKVLLAGADVPEVERRFADGERLYAFDVTDYPIITTLEEALSHPGTMETEGPPSKVISAELSREISSFYTSARQRLQSPPRDE